LERRSGDPQSCDLVDAVRAVAAAVGSLGVQKKPAGAAAAERVGLDEPPAAVVPEFDAKVVGGGEAHGLQRYPDAPGGDGGWRRPCLLVLGAGQWREVFELGGASHQPNNRGSSSRKAWSGGRAGNWWASI